MKFFNCRREQIRTGLLKLQLALHLSQLVSNRLFLRKYWKSEVLKLKTINSRFKFFDNFLILIPLSKLISCVGSGFTFPHCQEGGLGQWGHTLNYYVSVKVTKDIGQDFIQTNFLCGVRFYLSSLPGRRLWSVRSPSQLLGVSYLEGFPHCQKGEGLVTNTRIRVIIIQIQSVC